DYKTRCIYYLLKNLNKMNRQFPLCLTLVFFFYGAHAAKITFTNKCTYTVWPGTLAGADGLKPQLALTGFELAPDASNSVDVPSPWFGRFWGRTGCSYKGGRFSCDTADCRSGQVACNNGAGPIPPATLAELTIASNGGQDVYDISNVYGFNVPMSIAPQGGTGDCKQTSCPADINSECPAELQVKGSNGNVVACKSTCLPPNQPQYCCPEVSTCPPSQHSQYFKNKCPQAYSYTQDDRISTFTCFGNPSYTVTYCP
ncbi:hypothetical protein WDU94_013953, partial [Cyamophila willieti]